jgi:hypothetical protein
MAKKRARWAAPNMERLLPNLQSPDEEARGDAVRGLCPCHAGWDAFEGHVSDVMRMLRDPSRDVRAHALHVLEDAARMQHAEELRFYLEAGEERIGEKGASTLYRSMEERLKARRDSKVRKRKRGYRGAGGAA